MNQLERELLQTLKNFVTQYEEDKQQQNEQISNLLRQLETLSNTVNNLSDRVEQLSAAYQDISNVLEE